jgi:hypothetical protein
VNSVTSDPGARREATYTRAPKAALRCCEITQLLEHSGVKHESVAPEDPFRMRRLASDGCREPVSYQGCGPLRVGEHPVDAAVDLDELLRDWRKALVEVDDVVGSGALAGQDKHRWSLQLLQGGWGAS